MEPSPRPSPDEATFAATEGVILRHFRPLAIWLVATIAFILTVAALRAAAVVVVPFVVALFIALAVAPLDAQVRARLPARLKWVGHAVAMTLVSAILAVFFLGVYLAAHQAVAQMPSVGTQLRSLLPRASAPQQPEAAPAGANGSVAADRARAPSAAPAPEGAGGPVGAGERAPAAGAEADSSDTLAGELSKAVGGGDAGTAVLLLNGVADLRGLAERFGAYLLQHATSFARSILGAVASFIAGLVLVFFLVLLMLVEAPTWRAKAAATLGARGQARSEDTLAVMARSFRWYILVRTALGIASGTLYAGWLAIFGVDLLVVWWALAFLLNFIPTLGSIIAAALPIVYALVTQDFATASLVAVGLVVIEQVMGNYVDPLVQGRQLSVSPLVTFLSLLLFGWMWGVIGALLAVPIAVFAVIVLAHLPGLQSVALLLSDCGDMECLRRRTGL